MYWAWHRLVTEQGYLDALQHDALPSIVDAWLMLFGWIVYAPPRAPMAHLFDRATDAHEVWIGIGAVIGLCLLAADRYRRPQHDPLLALSILCTGLLFIPAAIGIPFIGVAPLRYAYMPMALLLVTALSGWQTKPTRAWMMAIALVSSIGMFRIAERVPAFDNDLNLWSAELKIEANNPYAAGSKARALIATPKSKEGIELWASAIDKARPGIRVFEVDNERWLLAQTAFMKGHPSIALEQVNQLMHRSEQTGRPLPSMAHCLRADSLDAMGRHEEASAAAVHCRH